MRIFYRFIAPMMLGVLVLAGCVASVPAVVSQSAAQQSTAQEASDQEMAADEVLVLEVAEDFTSYVFAPDIATAEGYPAHGSPFLTQGYIYPEGTLNGTNGVNDDGSPEFPDKVLGTWICRGWILGDMTSGEDAPIAITTQVFDLNGAYGGRTIISDGYEYMAPGDIFRRAIVGGSGEYHDVRGEQIQEVLGISENMGMSFRFELHLER